MKERTKKVNVKFHSGYKGQEIPRAVIFGQNEVPIEKIIERKRILDQKTGKEWEVYKIKITDETAILKIHHSSECEMTFLIS